MSKLHTTRMHIASSIIFIFILRVLVLYRTMDSYNTKRRYDDKTWLSAFLHHKRKIGKNRFKVKSIWQANTFITNRREEKENKRFDSKKLSFDWQCYKRLQCHVVSELSNKWAVPYRKCQQTRLLRKLANW